jgi:hypothetical protein
MEKQILMGVPRYRKSLEQTAYILWRRSILAMRQVYPADYGNDPRRIPRKPGVVASLD